MSAEIEMMWIKKALKGDQDAFASLIIPYERKVYNIAYQIFKNEQDAFDAAQEVFVKVYRNLSKFGFNSSFSTWLHRLAMNTCIDEYRKRKRHADNTTSIDQEFETDDSSISKQYRSNSDTPEEAIIRQETIQDVQTAIERLNDEHKQIILLRDIQGFSYDEVAEILDLSLGTVKSRLSRARFALKELLSSRYNTT